MNEFEQPLKISPDTQLVTAFHKEYTLKRKELVRRGLTYWEVDLINMEAIPVKIRKKVAIGLDGKPVKKNEASYREDRVYIWALTKYHALRKAVKEFEAFLAIQKSK